ncbi:MAG: hypothetical protein ACC707_01595, partial [Thiohalomonadales bacterium]
MATREQLENALRNADLAGDTQAAQQLANAIRSMPTDRPIETPTDYSGVPSDQLLPGQMEPEPEKELRSDIGIPLLNKIIEPVSTVASSIVAEPLAGLAGMLSAPFTSPEQATKNIEAVRDALTYIPKTKQGMDILQQVAGVLEPVGKAVTAAEDFAGDTVYDKTGSPVAGAIAKTLPTAAMEATGLGGVKRAAKAGKTANRAVKNVSARIKPKIKDTFKDIKEN